jgi:hypothetical protein
VLTQRKGLKAVIAVAVTVALAAAGLAMSTTAASAATFPYVDITSAVNQQAGHITAGEFNAAVSIFPFADTNTIEVVYRGVTDSADVAVPDGFSLLATFCGNQDTSGTPKPLLGDDIGSLQGVAAHCAPTSAGPLTATALGGDITVTGTLSFADLPAGNTCTTGQVLPCLLIVSDLNQTVTFALPVINPRAASVAGPLGKVLSGACNPTAAPPTGCPITRVSDAGGPVTYPVAFGGGGYATTAQIPTAAFAPASAELCNLDATSCGALFGSFLPTGANPFLPVGGGNPANAGIGSVDVNPLSPTAGRLSGAFLFESGAPAIPDDYLMKITVTYLTAGFAPITTLVQYASLRILDTPTTSLSPAGGPVNTETSVLGSGFEPWEPVSMNMTDGNNNIYPLNAAAQTTTTNGLGDIIQGAPSKFIPNFPATGVRVTVSDYSPDPQPPGVVAQVFNLAFDSAGAASYCDAGTDGEECAVGIIVTITVEPGTLQELVTDAPNDGAFAGSFGDGGGADIGDTTTELSELDLSTILLNDPDSWYPLSEPTPLPVVTVGDFRGANTGWVVTASASDLIGATQPGNIIPAADVWPAADSALCDVSTITGTEILTANDIPVAYGVATPGDFGDDPLPDIISPLSADADEPYEVCTLDPDTDGLAGGMWDMDFSVLVAGRPITPVDDYAGLIVITVTSQ